MDIEVTVQLIRVSGTTTNPKKVYRLLEYRFPADWEERDFHKAVARAKELLDIHADDTLPLIGTVLAVWHIDGLTLQLIGLIKQAAKDDMMNAHIAYTWLVCGSHMVAEIVRTLSIFARKFNSDLSFEVVTSPQTSEAVVAARFGQVEYLQPA
jgi:hypothetical protein